MEETISNMTLEELLSNVEKILKDEYIEKDKKDLQKIFDIVVVKWNAAFKLEKKCNKLRRELNEVNMYLQVAREGLASYKEPVDEPPRRAVTSNAMYKNSDGWDFARPFRPYTKEERKVRISNYEKEVMDLEDKIRKCVKSHNDAMKDLGGSPGGEEVELALIEFVGSNSVAAITALLKPGVDAQKALEDWGAAALARKWASMDGLHTRGYGRKKKFKKRRQTKRRQTKRR